MSEQPDKYFKHRILPDPKLNDCWGKIIVPLVIKRILMNYAKAMINLRGISPVIGTFYKAILLHGPRGTGKSTLAMGYANAIAEKIWYGKPVNLFLLNSHTIFSEWEGRSAKELAQAFELVRFSAGHNPTILIVDEVEALGYNRRGMIQSSDPTDLIRAVDTLLNELDELRFIDNVLVIATSNFPEAIDDAVWDRFDIKIEFKYPDESGRAKIIENCFEEYSKVGLCLDGADAFSVAQMTRGLSARALSRLVWWTHVITGKPYERLSIDDVCRAAGELVSQEKVINDDTRRISDEHNQ